MELMLLRLLLFGFCFSITYQDWIVPKKDATTKYLVYNNAIKLTTNSSNPTGDEVCLDLFTNTGSHITNVRWNFKDWSYNISHCIKDTTKKFTTEISPLGKKTWEVYKAAKYLNITCNDKTVLHYVFDNADENPENPLCSNNLNYKTVATVKFDYCDSATTKFYLNDEPGCRGFEAEWMIKGIENSTDIEVPIPHETAVPIKCIGNNSKLSGPDNITCLKNNTFSGLSDIYCSGWIVPVKDNTVRYPVYNNTIKITTENKGLVLFALYTNTDSDSFLTFMSWSFEFNSCYIYECGITSFTSLPVAAGNENLEWEVYKTETYLNITCNGKTVLHYLYDNADENPQCSNRLNNKTVATVKFYGSDSATRKFYRNDSGCRAGSYTTEEGVCELCPPGTFSRTGAAQVCTECPNGKTSEAGATSENDCS